MNTERWKAALDLSSIKPEVQLKDYVKPIADDIQWRAATEERARQIRGAARKRRLFGWLRPDLKRTEAYVARYYTRWQKTNLMGSNPQSDPASIPTLWRGKRMLMSGWGWRYLHLLRLYKLIELIRPQRVLEVGCGNGFFPTMLACRFPNLEFHGLELTPEGVKSAKDVQGQSQLPAQLAAFSPEPLADLTAHKKAVFQQGTATAIPFAERAFDLVYTVDAIEQMEAIRRAALSEIARVTGRYLSNFECFRDVNETGLQRNYIESLGYYEGRISELKDFGLTPVFDDRELPQRFYMNVAHVVSEKAPA